MQPRSFSASAMTTAESCMARYKAENIDYARGIGNSAASLGTSVHGALEMFVKACYLEKTQEPSEKFLLDLFKMSYMTTFGTADLETIDYFEGVEMLRDWFKRTDFSTREVISCEVKTHFMIPVMVDGSPQEIPFNYIWDRFDKTGEREYTVVDYKTNRWGINPLDLKKKIQARAYALAAQIQQPDAEKIWVQFDMLRHDGPVGIVFTREENIATWKFLKEKAQQIIDTPDTDIPETLNDTCLFCVRKQSCKALKANVAAGGIFSITKPEQAIDHRAQLDYQKRAIESALKELDSHVLTLAKGADEFEWQSDTNVMTVSIRETRSIDADMAEMVLPPAIFKKYGGSSFTMGNVDKLLKGTEIDEPTKAQLRSLIYKRKGEPSLKTQARGAIGDE